MMTVYVGTRMDLENDGEVTIVAVSTARLVVIEAIKANIDSDDEGNDDEEDEDDEVESLSSLDEPFDPALNEWAAHGGMVVWQIAECQVIE